MMGDLSIGGFALAVFIISFVIKFIGNIAIKSLKRKEAIMQRASKKNVVQKSVENISSFISSAGASAIGNVLLSNIILKG